MTDKQAQRLLELQEKGSKSKELQDLIEKRDFIPEPKLSTGAKTYIEDVWYGEKFNFQKSFSSKFTEKGKLNESKSIRELSKYLGIFTAKNEIWIQNQYIHGTPDIRLNAPKCTIDTKNVYYPNGLKFFESESEKHDYIWQIHGYNWLDSKDVGFVARILTNPPLHLIEKEVWNYWKEAEGEGQPTDEFRAEIEAMFNFEAKPIDERVNLFRVDTTENEIKIIKTAVRLANEYYKELTKKFGNRNKEVIEFFKSKKNDNRNFKNGRNPATNKLGQTAVVGR